MRVDEEPVVVTATFEACKETVWDAITVLDQMHKWYFDNIPAFEPVVGFETEFNIENEGRNFLHLWRITEVIPGIKIAYGWKFKDYPGDSVVSFGLAEQNKKTTLKVTAEVLEDFPDHIPEFRRDSCVNGWEFFIQNRLKEFLDITSQS